MDLKKCRNDNCKWPLLPTVIDLGTQPWCNDFLEEEELGTENTYPLRLVRCSKCTLLQLDYTVPKEVMFGNHDYLSGNSESLRLHFAEVAEKAVEYTDLKSDDLIVDIGGNDGTQLIEYQALGYNNVLNVEPSIKTADKAESNGVITLRKYFDEELCINHFEENEAKIINAAGVFFHLENLTGVIKGINHILAEDGALIIQFGYAGQVLDKGHFDFIYHEHLCLYNLTSLCVLLEPYGLYPSKVWEADIHNGSLVVFFTRNKLLNSGDKIMISSVLNREAKEHTLSKAKSRGYEVEASRSELRVRLEKIYREGKSVWAYGAPAKGNTLLNYYGVSYPLVQQALEINPFKVNKFMPGSHIPILDENLELSTKRAPDYLLLLAHNLKDEILSKDSIKQLRKDGTKIIIPLPNVEII